MLAIGQGGAADLPVGGGSAGMDREEKLAIRSGIDVKGPCREWWAGFGTVTAVLDGFGLAGFEVDEDGGKCLFLYV